MQWYVQDQWKAQRRLTLNYGVRMGWFSQWAQRQLDASNFDPARFDPAKACALSPVLRQWYAGHGFMSDFQAARPEPDYR